MKVIVAKDYDEMSAKAFEVMEKVVKGNPEAILGLATGSTPIGLYKNMINALLEKMQQDIQVLGIGSNGHIAFNEPGTPFGSVTHIVDLAESTIKDNSRMFASIDEVPRQAFTMGLKNIMNAKKILILANGANKAKAVFGLVKGEVTENVPASILQLHPDCTLVCDEAAASLL